MSDLEVLNVLLCNTRYDVPRFSIEFTPQLIAHMRSAICINGVPATHIVIGGAAFSKAIHDGAFMNLIDPEVRLERVAAGHLGSVLGMSIVSNASMPPAECTRHKVQANLLAVVSIRDDGIVDMVCCTVW